MSELLGIDEPVCVKDYTRDNPASLRGLLDRVFNQVDDALFVRADTATNNTHQNKHFESMRQLRVVRHALTDDFLMRVAELGDLSPASLSQVCALFNRCAQAQQLPLTVLSMLSRSFHLLSNEYVRGELTPEEPSAITSAYIDTESPFRALLAALTKAQAYQAAERRSADLFISTDDALAHVGAVTLIGKLLPKDQESARLVRATFDALLTDRHIAVPAARWLMLLEIPVLRIALTDETFFAANSHPARQLLQALTIACIGWEAPKERLVYDGFYRLLSDVVSELIEEESLSIVHFERAHGDMDAYLTGISKTVEAMGERAWVMESLGQQLQLARRQANASIQQLINHYRVDEPLGKFLRNVWSDLLTMGCFSRGDITWDALMATTTLMVERLVGESSQPTDTQWIDHVLSVTQAIAAEQTRYLDKVTAFLAPYQNVQPLPVSTSVEKSALEQEIALGQDALDQQAQNEAPQEWIDPYVLEQVGAFSQGMWFTRQLDNGDAEKCRLVAVIRSIDKYIFTNRAGAKVAEETRASLATALQTGRMTSLDDYLLFDRTLESVIGGLRDLREQFSS